MTQCDRGSGSGWTATHRALAAAVAAGLGLPADVPPGPVDWTWFEQLLRRHRVAPLVHRGGLARLGAPADLVARVGDQARDAAVRALAQLGLLTELLGGLRAAGIDVLVLKGLPLAQAGYGDPAVRDPGDIDLLVPPGQVAATAELLIGLGLEVASWPNGPAPTLIRPALAWAAELPALSEISFTGAGTRIDLHWRLFENRALFPVRPAWLTRPALVQVGPVSVPVLPPDQLWPYLAVHGTKHAWRRLKWLADVPALAGWRPVGPTAGAPAGPPPDAAGPPDADPRSGRDAGRYRDAAGLADADPWSGRDAGRYRDAAGLAAASLAAPQSGRRADRYRDAAGPAAADPAAPGRRADRYRDPAAGPADSRPGRRADWYRDPAIDLADPRPGPAPHRDAAVRPAGWPVGAWPGARAGGPAESGAERSVATALLVAEAVFGPFLPVEQRRWADGVPGTAVLRRRALAALGASADPDESIGPRQLAGHLHARLALRPDSGFRREEARNWLILAGRAQLVPDPPARVLLAGPARWTARHAHPPGAGRAWRRGPSGLQLPGRSAGDGDRRFWSGAGGPAPDPPADRQPLRAAAGWPVRAGAAGRRVRSRLGWALLDRRWGRWLVRHAAGVYRRTDRLAGLARLGAGRRGLLLEAVLELARASVELVLLPSDRIVPRLGERAGAVEPAVGLEQSRMAARTGSAVAAAARRLPWRPTCLRQAVAAGRMLRRRGVASRIHLGVATGVVTGGATGGTNGAATGGVAGRAGAGVTGGPTALTAHAWLTVGGRTVLGGGPVDQFTPVAAFAAGAATPARRAGPGGPGGPAGSAGSAGSGGGGGGGPGGGAAAGCGG
ncbi:MAG TPA: lasso peptide biosynthesis B2 protein [Mycobacteriales bacterium]|nr:lasso peptide biosynthesis B2 protein [Mycobacteriales bacterium]